MILEPPQRLEVTVSDSGSGIPNLDQIFEGRYKSETGLGMGLIGTRRLMDEFHIETSSKGTTVRMAKRISYHHDTWTQRTAHDLSRKMQSRAPENPYEEIEQQNQELLKTLQELRSRQEELELLNRELEDTNRGVVALYAELDERADYLRRASELKTKFLSNVSHEFRTPLNSVISLARLLLERIDGDLTSEQAKQVRYIESSARDLQEMVNDLLDLAKVEAGKIRIRPKRFEVHELFSALKGMLKPLLADNTSVDLVFDDTTEIPALRTDEGKVSQILRNLISNALKFTPNGKVTVSARMIENQDVEFTVADTGIGIAREHHEDIFREFSQVENPLQEKYRGTGLGLPLCRNLAMLLGGSIWLESQPGEGSTFVVRLPAIYVGEAMQTEDANVLPVPDFHRAPILFLEDDSETLQLFETICENPSSSRSWPPPWRRQKAGLRGIPLPLLWLTYILETICRGSFIKQLRDRLPELPLIVTSSHDEMQTAYATGANLFLQKPVERETLLNELRHAYSSQWDSKGFAGR